MSTIRVAKRDRYTSVARPTLNDHRLSFRARGVLVWLLDKPDNWKSNAQAIANAGCEGRDAVRAALSELEQFGYLVREKHRDEAGQFYTEVTVYERPNQSALSESVQGGIPVAGLTWENDAKPQVTPETGNQASENQASEIQAPNKELTPTTENPPYPQTEAFTGPTPAGLAALREIKQRLKGGQPVEDVA